MLTSKEILRSMEDVWKFFGITENLPIQQLLSRSEQSPKIYFISSAVSQLIGSDDKKRLQVINTGVKFFIKQHGNQDTNFPFRLSQEGLQWLYPFITKRKITITEKEFFNLLDNQDPFDVTFSLETQRAVGQIEQGSIIFVLGPNCKSEGWNGMVVSGWKGKVSMKLLLPKEEILALSQLARRE